MSPFPEQRPSRACFTFREIDNTLAKVLQATLPLPMTKVTETSIIEVNHVYVIPSNKSVDRIVLHSDVGRVQRGHHETDSCAARRGS